MNIYRNYVIFPTLVWEFVRFYSSTSHYSPHAYFNSSNARLCYVWTLPTSSFLSGHKRMQKAIMHEDWILVNGSNHCHYNPELIKFPVWQYVKIMKTNSYHGCGTKIHIYSQNVCSLQNCPAQNLNLTIIDSSIQWKGPIPIGNSFIRTMICIRMAPIDNCMNS